MKLINKEKLFIMQEEPTENNSLKNKRKILTKQKQSYPFEQTLF